MVVIPPKSDAVVLPGPRAESLREQLTAAGFTVHGAEPRALHALPLSGERPFLVCRGDLHAELDWARLWQAHASREALGTVALRNADGMLPNPGVAMEECGRLTGGSSLRAAGVAVLHPALLRRVPRERDCDLFTEVLPPLVDARTEIHGYLTCEHVAPSASPAPGRRCDLAVVDRDGVLVEDVDLLCDPDALVLVPGAAEGLRRLNEAGVKTALATNQSVVARGICDEAQLHAVHARMAEMLAAEGAHLDSVHYCPHHPDTHYPEGVPALRGPCRCRKPSTGMVEDALAQHSVPASRAVVIGDRSGDLQMAHNAGLPAIGLATGAGCSDGAFPARPTWRFANLAEAAEWLTGTT